MPREVLNVDVIPALNDQEMKYVKPPQEDAGLKTSDTDIQDDEGFKFEEKKTDQMIEETKGDQDLPSEPIPPRQYHVIPPHELFKPDWIQIPVKPVIRFPKQVSSYSYSYSHSSTYGPKFENQNAIPRLFWFPKTASPYEVLREIITQFSFVQSDNAGTHDAQAHFEENWKVLIEYLNDPEKSKQVLDLSEFDQDKAEFPLTINLKNPYFDSYKSTYFLPKCRNCGEQSCRNCPMPVNGHATIWELIETIVSQKSFQDNGYLYRLNKDDLKTKQEGIQNGEDTDVKSA